MSGAESQNSRFLSLVLPFEHSDGKTYFNLHWAGKRTDGKGKYWSGRCATTLNDYLRLTKIWSDKGTDVYMCMSSQSGYDERVSKQGKPYKQARRFQAEVVRLKSFFLDIDVKEGAYATQDEAISALKEFCETLELPAPSAVVKSGTGGMHVYWACERPITIEEWQPVANALAHAVIQFGLICDTQCTIDSVRILRLPGTLNHKIEPPGKVELFSLGEPVVYDQFRAALKGFEGLTPLGNKAPTDVSALPRRAKIEGPSELSAGIEGGSNEISIEQVTQVCPVVRDAYITGGKDYANPLWRMMLQVAMFTVEGSDAAHQLSFGHEDYSPEETDREYDRVVRTKIEKDLGWPQCEKIHLVGAEQCKTCPLYRNKQSPFNWINQPEDEGDEPSSVAAISPPTKIDTNCIMPEGYSRRPDGFVYKLVKDPDTGAVGELKISDYQFTDAWLQADPWVLHFTTVTRVGKKQKVEIPFDAIHQMGGPGKLFGEFGMVFSDTESKAVKEFCVAWIKRLQRERDAVVSAVPYGWVENEGVLEGFSYAGHVWGPGSCREAPHDDSGLFQIYSPRGALQPWVEAMEIITNQENPALETIVAASFAAPLMRFNGFEGVLVSGYGTTGLGKTTALDVGLAVWANPQMGKNGLNDTINHTFAKLGRIKSLPIYWDEIQNDQQQRTASEMLFQLTGGKERGRQKSSLKIAVSGSWQTMMITCANVSLVDAIMKNNKSHTAGLARLFEFEVTKPAHGKGRLDLADASRAFAKLKTNHGHVGQAYAQFLGANFERIDAETGQWFKDLSKDLGAVQEERFWVIAASQLLSGARYANEIGVANFHIDQMKQFVANTFNFLRLQVKSAPVDMSNKVNIGSVLTQYMNEMEKRHTIKTDHIHTGVGKPPKNYVHILNDVTTLDGAYVHFSRDDGLLRISISKINEWLEYKEMSARPVTKALEEQFGAKVIVARIGAGTHLVRGQERLYEIDMKARGNKSFFEDLLQ